MPKYERRSPAQFMKISAEGVFMEVMLDALKIDKVFLNFVKHDDSRPEKQRIVAEIGIYLDPWEAARLGGDILSGKLAALARKERKRVAAEQEKMSGAKKTIYPRHIWDSRSGVSATKLASWGKDRKDGMSLSKWFKVSPGLKAAWVISAESGPGEETGKGIIEPRYKAPENIIRIPMSDDCIKEFGKALDAILYAYAAERVHMVLNANIGTGRKED